MATETCEVLLHGQMQEGLWYEINKSPAVSGAWSYKELCIAAQNEEKWINDLKKQQNYICRTLKTKCISPQHVFMNW